jgi:UDP-N-acetylmuramate dehydrogenase
MINKIIEKLGLDSVLINEELKKHTTFKIGGKCKALFLPSNIEQIRFLVDILSEKKERFMLIGNGSNILFSDNGFDGYIIKISESFSNFEVNGTNIISDSGILLSRIAKIACQDSLTGLEFATGIPGSLGGGVAMNAGAYDGELKDVVTGVDVYEYGKGFYHLNSEEMQFSYRHSYVQDTGIVVLRVYMELKKGNQEQIDLKVADLNFKRTSKQPLALPSAGSTFRRPLNGYASKLIEDSGLKGLRFGGASVSDKHSGFIVNVDNATFTDVITLIGIVQKNVFEKFSIKLETEIKIIEG